jgi:chemotaxis protein methyltransferase CheR
MQNQKTLLSDYHYNRFREFIHEITGIDFPTGRRLELERAVAACFSKTNYATIDYYLNSISQVSHDHQYLCELVESLTVNETYFFRDENQFNLLKKKILPEIIAKHNTSDCQLRIWSAGCASGEEPYSVAMLIKELIPYSNLWDVLILATDIDNKVLKLARQAKYSQWSFRETPADLRKKYFRKQGNQYLLASSIKEMVNFKHLNLRKNVYPSPLSGTHDLDLILCRNVAIYFSPEIIEKMISRFYHCLAKGGWLMLGASDPPARALKKFDCCEIGGQLIYRRPLEKAKRLVEKSELSETNTGALSNPTKEKLNCKPSHQPLKPREHTLACGCNLYRLGYIDQALFTLKKVVVKGVEADKACYQIAVIYVDRNDLTTAEHWLNRAINKNLRFKPAYILLAYVYQEQNLLEEAITTLRKALYFNKGFIEAYLYISNLYRKIKEEEKAKKALENAKRLQAKQENNQSDQVTVKILRKARINA